MRLSKSEIQTGGLLMCSLLLGGLLFAACSRDPQVLKKKHYDKATSYMQAAKYREAEIEFSNAIQIDPKYAEAHYGLAQCLMKQKDWSHAYQELMRTVEFAPTNWQAQLDIANFYLAAHRLQDARDRAELILKGDPQNAGAEVVLSNADALQGDETKSLAEGQKAIEMAPDRAASYLNTAAIQEHGKDLVAAEKNFKKALELDPKNPATAIAVAEFYERQKKWPEAEQQLQSAIALDPKNPESRARLAQLFLFEGKKDAAEQTLRDAKAAMPDNSAGYRLLGEYYIAQGQMDKALAEFASLHTEHPKDASVADTYAELLIGQNKLDDASKVVDATLKSAPSDAGALISQSQILERQGKAQDAVHVLEGVTKNNPDNAAAHYHLGVAYAAASNYGQAEAEWREAIRLRPNIFDAHRALAVLAIRKNDTDLLKQSSEQMIKIAPAVPEGYIFHARALYATGNQVGAEADLKKVIEIAPQSPTGYVQMGDLRVSQKKPDEATKFYELALERAPSSVEAMTGLVNIDLARKDNARALKLVQDQMAKIPANSRFYALLGQVEMKNQNSAAAEAAFEKATEIDNNNVQAFMMLAAVEASRGSVDQAITNYERALQSNPRNARIDVSLGELLEAKGQWQQAEDRYQKALDAQPDYPVAANNLAYLMLEHGGNINVAVSLAQTARRGLPDLPNSADTLGWAYYHQGVYNAAIDLLREAVKGDDKNATYHYHLGMSYEKANNYAMAKKELEYTLQVNPNYSQADEIRKILAESPPKAE